MTSRSYSFSTGPMSEVSQENLDLILNAPTRPPAVIYVNSRRARIYPGGQIVTEVSARVRMDPSERHGSISTMQRVYKPETDAEMTSIMTGLIKDRYDIEWMGESW